MSSFRASNLAAQDQQFSFGSLGLQAPLRPASATTTDSRPELPKVYVFDARLGIFHHWCAPSPHQLIIRRYQLIDRCLTVTRTLLLPSSQKLLSTRNAKNIMLTFLKPCRMIMYKLSCWAYSLHAKHIAQVTWQGTASHVPLSEPRQSLMIEAGEVLAGKATFHPRVSIWAAGNDFEPWTPQSGAFLCMWVSSLAIRQRAQSSHFWLNDAPCSPKGSSISPHGNPL